MQDMSKKIDKLEEQKAKIEARLQLAKSKEREQQRKLDTRKKILIGGAMMAMVKNGRMKEMELNLILDDALTNSRDRKLFGLPEKKK